MLKKRRVKRLVFMKKRRTKRFPFQHTVHFGPHRHPDITSYTTDFSDRGLCIKTDKVFQPGTKLYLTIEADDRNYRAEGVVAWEKRVTPKDVQLVKVDMGVKFTHVDPALEAVYEERFKEVLDEHGYVEIF